MLLAILLVELTMVVYMAGLLIVAIGVTTRHGDPSATYRLYAIRDQLIASVAFKGVDRENPWLVALYENVNRVLLHSNLLGGPTGWSRAAAAGHSQATPTRRATLHPFPRGPEECPEQLRALTPEICAALEHLLHNHLGFGIYMSAQEKAQRRIQQENAKTLLRMMTKDIRQGEHAHL